MIADDGFRLLHDRATRGEPLTLEELASLDAWYAALDRAEQALLEQASPPDELAGFRVQIDAMAAEVAAAAGRVREATAENERLRREVVELRRRVAGLSLAQPV